MERLSKNDVHKMQWEVWEAKIGNWIQYMQIAVRICSHILAWWYEYLSTILYNMKQVKLLFWGEKKICDQIFEGVDSL